MFSSELWSKFDPEQILSVESEEEIQLQQERGHNWTGGYLNERRREKFRFDQIVQLLCKISMNLKKLQKIETNQFLKYLSFLIKFDI